MPNIDAMATEVARRIMILFFVIDTSSSMKYPKSGKFNKLEFSAVCAAAVINLLRKQRDAVSLTLFDKNIDFSSEAKTEQAKLSRLKNKC